MTSRKTGFLHYSETLSTLVIILIILASFSPSAMCQDVYEDDDTFENANVLMLNDQNPGHRDIQGYEFQQFHTFHHDADRDWVKFYAIDGETPCIITTTPTNECLDAVIEIYASDGQSRLMRIDNTIGEERLVSFNPPHNGIYYACIKNNPLYCTDSNPEYMLMLTQPDETFDGFIHGEVSPPVETVLFATQIGGRSVTNGALTNSDGFYFLPHATGLFVLTATTLTCPDVEIRDFILENTTLKKNIIFSDNSYIIQASAGPGGTVSPSGTVSVCEGAIATFTIAPSYASEVADIVVDGASKGAVSSYTFDDVTGTHTLMANFNYEEGDAYEDDDIYENAKVLTLTSRNPAHLNVEGYQWFQNHNFHDAGDKDWVKIYTLANEGPYTITVLNPGADCDPVIDIYADNGQTLLERVDESRKGVDEIARFSPPKDGLYYVCISHSDSEFPGRDASYQLMLTLSGAPVDGLIYGSVSLADGTDLPAEGAIVTMAYDSDVTGGAIANADGIYFMPHRPGEFVLTARTPSCWTYTDTETVQETDPTLLENVELVESSYATITAEAKPNGTISPSGSVIVCNGLSQTFEITPNSGYTIRDVTLDGESQEPVSPYTLEPVNDTHKITAYFAKVHIISARAGDFGDISPSGDEPVADGERLEFTLTPVTGYHADDVVIDGVSYSDATKCIFSKVSRDHEITVNFDLKNYTIAMKGGSNGTISPDGTISVAHGASHTFEIKPHDGYAIEEVLIKNEPLESSYSVLDYLIENNGSWSYTIEPVENDYTITVRFVELHKITFSLEVNGVLDPPCGSSPCLTVHFVGLHEITFSMDVNGVLDPPCESSSCLTVRDGGDLQFTLTPPSGYAIDSVKSDGKELEALPVDQNGAQAYNVGAVKDALGIHVVLVEEHTITVNIAGDGVMDSCGSPPCSIKAYHEYSKEFIFEPSPGNAIKEVTLDGEPIFDKLIFRDDESIYSFESVVSDHVINVIFTNQIHTISVNSTGEDSCGFISPSGDVFVAQGNPQMFTITTNPGCAIDDIWLGDDVSVFDKLTFRDNTAIYALEPDSNYSLTVSFTTSAREITVISDCCGSIFPSGGESRNVFVTSGKYQTFTIVPDSGYAIDDVKVDGVSEYFESAGGAFTFDNVEKDHDLSVIFTDDVYKIAAQWGNDGAISLLVGKWSEVSSDDSGVWSGRILMPKGIDQAITISPHPGFAIEDVWVNGEPAEFNSAGHTYTPPDASSNRTIVASFTDNTHPITVETHGNGTVTPSGNVPVAVGKSQEFIFTPDSSEDMVYDVRVDGNSVGAKSRHLIEDVESHVALEVFFTKKGNEIFTIEANANENGSISPEGTRRVVGGSSHDYTITPGEDYVVDSIKVDGASESFDSAGGTYQFLNINDDHTIEASFMKDEHTITIQWENNGSISPIIQDQPSDDSGKLDVAHGSDQTFTITPMHENAIELVEVDGALVEFDSAGGEFLFDKFNNIRSDHELKVTFTDDVYEITAEWGDGGTISPLVGGWGKESSDESGLRTGAVWVAKEKKQTFQITPDSAGGYAIKEVKMWVNEEVGVNEDPEELELELELELDSAGDTYTFSDVSSDQTIKARFTKVTRTIEVETSGNGTVTPSGEVLVAEGKNQKFAISPNDNHRLVVLKVDGIDYPNSTTCHFVNVSSPHKLEAIFKPESRTINIDSEQHGTVEYTIDINLEQYRTADPIDFIDVDYEADIRFKITPEDRYAIKKVKVKKESPEDRNPVIELLKDQDGSWTYTFREVEKPCTIDVDFVELHTITVILGEYGAIDPPCENSPCSFLVNHDDDFPLTITPNAGCAIKSVTLNGEDHTDIDRAEMHYELTEVDKDYTLEIGFTKAHKITLNAGRHGVITPLENGAITPPEQSATTPPESMLVYDGDSQRFEITPEDGYAIENVLVEKASTEAGVSVLDQLEDQNGSSIYTLKDVENAYTINASFVEVHTIECNIGEKGAIVPICDDSSGPVTVHHGADIQFKITPDEGYAIKDVLVEKASTEAGVSVLDQLEDQNGLWIYTFNNVENAYTIHANFVEVHTIECNIGGKGAIVPICDAPSCPATVHHGAKIQFKITPDEGYAIKDVLVEKASTEAGVSVLDQLEDQNGSWIYTFENVEKDQKIHVDFVKVHTIEFDIRENGELIDPLCESTPCSMVVHHGDNGQFTLKPDPGYDIDYVNSGCQVMHPPAPDGQNGSLTYILETVGSDCKVDVVFKKIYTITAYESPNGVIDPVGSQIVNPGESRIFRSTPEEEYAINDVVIKNTTDGIIESIGVHESYTFENISNDHEIRALFAEPHTITVIAGGHGAISPSGEASILDGDSQTFTITPDDGYMILDVRVDGEAMGDLSNYLFTDVQSDQTIQALFAPIGTTTFTLKTRAGEHGSVTPRGDVKVAKGGTQAFSATPDVGCVNTDIKVDNSPIGAKSSFTFTNVQGDRDITVDFKPILFAGDFNGDLNGDIMQTIVTDPNAIEWRLKKSTGGRFETTDGVWAEIPMIKNDVLLTGDFNGDGRADIAVAREFDNALVKWMVGCSNGESFSCAGDCEWTEFGKPGNAFIPGDFNGDGLTDIAAVEKADAAQVHLVVGISDGARFSTGSFEESVLNIEKAEHSFFAGDFNGDGSSDIAIAVGVGPTIEIGSSAEDAPPVGADSAVIAWSVFLSKKTWFFDPDWENDFGSPGDHFLTGDFNKDGKTDIATGSRETPGVVKWKVAISTGSSFTHNDAWINDFGADGDVFLAGDFNGDGAADIAACRDIGPSTIPYIFVAVSDAIDSLHDGEVWFEEAAAPE